MKLLSPSWNNEACHRCKDNHRKGFVDKQCGYLYNDKCIVEQFNIAINDKKRFNYFNSNALDTIKESFPEFTYSITYGTESVYIKEFDHSFSFYKDYTGQIYIQD
jgi:late competence protein required for DNA uptake (superfamily II DNA/RNA helicase)